MKPGRTTRRCLRRGSRTTAPPHLGGRPTALGHSRFTSEGDNIGGVERRVLVVDDDPNIRKLFSRILSRGGYAVHSVESGADALQALVTEAPFDLMVLDLCMPKPDGFEILKEVRLQYPGLRILVVSGFCEGALLPASTFLGATATLSKSEAPRRFAFDRQPIASVLT